MVFWRSVRRYYATYAADVAGTRDLQKVFETISGKDLKQFFDQWLYTPGQPQLDITWKYDAAAKLLFVEINQMQKKVFHFPLSIKINFPNGNSTKEKVLVNNTTGTFKTKTDQKPTSIIIDPDTESLMHYNLKEK